MLPKLPMMLLVFALESLLLISSTTVAQNTTRSVPETVVFSIKKYPDSDVHIEPIVIINGGKYTSPPVNDDVLSKTFNDTYFRVDRKYRLVFGGGDAGSLTVTKLIEPGCVGLLAQVDVETNLRLGGQVQALAVSNNRIGSGASSRRAPTEPERAEALELARTVYIQRKAPTALLKKMNTVNLTAVDLNRDGKFEMIGGFNIQGANMLAYNLFVIFEQTPAGKYRAAWNWYQKGTEESYEDRGLVDVIDLDGDGVAEVIAEGTYYESNDYVIYKRQAGTWRPVYKGGGGGC
jgi:hypothetical protein